MVGFKHDDGTPDYFTPMDIAPGEYQGVDHAKEGCDYPVTTTTPFEEAADDVLNKYVADVHENVANGRNSLRAKDKALAALTQLHESTLATATSRMKKTPREFRNALYQHFIDNDVSEATATTLAAESELYVEAYHAYQLRGVEFAAKQMGFDPEKKRLRN